MNLLNNLRWRYNEALARREYRLRRDKLAALPRFLIIDPSSRCNARCVMCPQSFRAPGDTGVDLAPSVFAKIAPAIPAAAHINLFSSGEPTLNPDLSAMLAAVRRRANPRAITWLGTNGKTLPDALLDELQAPGCGLQFSVDGGTREVFESIRRGIRFDELCATLARVKSRRDARPYPALSFSCTVSKRNLHDLAAVFQLARKYGIDKVIAYDLDPEGAAEREFVLNESDRQLYESQLPTIRASGVAAEITLAFGRPAALPPVASPPGFDPGPVVCRAPWKVFHLEANGEVRPCCTLRENMGDLSRQSFADIWNGEPYRALRRAFITQAGIPAACLACTDPLRY